MKFRDLSVEFLLVLISAFISSTIVTVLYNFFIHGSWAADWASSVRLSVILAVVLPMVHYRDKRQQKS